MNSTSRFSVEMPETLKLRIEEEKKKSERLDQEISKYQTELIDIRKTIGGVNSEAEEQKKLNKEIKNLENRLDKAMQKYNQTISQNKQLRLDIDKLRKDKNIYEATYKKLQEDLKNKRSDMEEAIASAELAYKNREGALKALEKLKQDNETEQKEHEEKWHELIGQIDQEKKRKEYIQMKEQEKLKDNSLTEIDPEDEQKIKNLAKLSEAEKNSNTESVKLVKDYEEALKKIKEQTGVETLQDLVNAFIGYEEKNTALLNFVNELTTEIDELESQIESTKSEIAKYKQMGALADTSKKRMLQKMEEKLSTLELKNSINDHRQKESMKTIASIKDQLKIFIQTLDPDSKILSEMDEEALTESNMIHYLSEVEVKANQIIQSYALIQAQKLQMEGIVKEDANLYRANIGALNNVNALGYQPQGSGGPITIALPEMLDEDEDPGETEDFKRPLSPEELRRKAEEQAYKSNKPAVRKEVKQKKKK